MAFFGKVLATGLLATLAWHGAWAAGEGKSFTLVERATTDATPVHGGKNADNVGDILTFANEMFDAANKEKVGTDQGYCVRLITGKYYECHWTLSLPAGQIVVEGPFLDAGDSVMAVLGGTGAYRTARGEMKLHARDAKGTAYDFTYDLD